MRERDLAAGGDPLLICLERQPEPVVVDAQDAVAIVRDRVRREYLHFLRHDADVEIRAAVVREAVPSKTVVEPAEKCDVVLDPDVGPAPTTPATAAEAAASETATTAVATATAVASLHPATR